MEKLVQDLKKGLLQMVEAVKGCRSTSTSTVKENEDGVGSKSDSAEHVIVEDRAIRLNAARGPARPGVPKGPPAQTQSKDQ